MSRFLDEKYAGLKPYTPGEQPKKTDELIKLNTNENKRTILNKIKK